MTVSATYSPESYTGNASTTAFSFPYQFIAQADLLVTLFDTSAGAYVSPQPVLNGAGTYDYAISGTVDTNRGEYLSGGTITFNNAPLANHRIDIIRVTARTQAVQLQPNGPFPAPTVEAALDRLTLIDQERDAASNGTPPQPTIGASPWSWTNASGQHQVVMMWSGAVSQVVLDGITIAITSTNPTTMLVRKGSTMVITYTAAPTLHLTPIG